MPPDVTFIIPHRGTERLRLLRLVAASTLAQQDVAVECIVVEQSHQQAVSGLPSDVRVIHAPYPSDPEPWRKSFAFNVGVEAARADIVVCHDGDILVPQNYAAEVLRLIRVLGYEAAFAQRFLFDLTETDTDALVAHPPGRLPPFVPLSVRQNWRGGTLAIRKETFEAIGGFDERFAGWGGEDIEFYDRSLTRRCYRWGYLPFVHLWHPPQQSKSGAQRDENLSFFDSLMKVPREDRVARLVSGAAEARQGVR